MIPACEALRSFADRVCAAGVPLLRYLDFWREFTDDDRASIRTMFRALFGGLGLRKPVAIQSVFAHHRTTAAAERATLRSERYVQVAFSGEAHHLDFADHDLNLVMAPDDPAANVVSFIGFGAYAHEYGLWPRFADLGKARLRQRAADRFCVAVISNPGGGAANRASWSVSRTPARAST
jgi:hypothetical protein